MSCSPSGRVHYEIEGDESISTAVIRAVSAVEGRHPLALRPLVHVVDPDALDTIFSPRENGEARVGGRLSFVFSRCRITVDNGEYITIELLDMDSSTHAGRKPSPNDSHGPTPDHDQSTGLGP